jgi:peptidyl-prolyl cis-trans isomerase D
MSNSKETKEVRDEKKADSQRKAFSVLAIAALAIIFAIDWGPGSRGCDSRTEKALKPESVATVNGKELPLSDFARMYSYQLQNFRAQQIPVEFLKQFGIEKQVMEQLVNEELLAQAAEARGLTASDGDLRETLEKDPNFQKNGKFDYDTYIDILNNYERTTDVKYEAKLRRKLAAQRLLDYVGSTAAVSDDEVRAKYQRDGNKAKATFVKFAPAMFADRVGAPKPPEVDAFAKTHEKEIAAAYELNKVTYFQPEKVKARQILLRLDKEATADKRAEVKMKIDNLHKDIVEHKRDFAEMAKLFSEDIVTKEKGGDLGWVERLQVPGDVANVLFALKPGEISKPVESPLGWHLTLAEDRKASEQRTLDQVKGEIAAQLLVKDKSKLLAKAAADKALEEAKKGKKLAELFPGGAPAPENASPFDAKPSTKPEAKETGEFSGSGEAVPQLGRAPTIAKAIFDRKDAGLVPEVMQTDEAYVVLAVDDRKVPTDAEYEAQKVQLRTDAVKAKQLEVREAFKKAIRQSGSVVTNDQAIKKVIGEG